MKGSRKNLTKWQPHNTVAWKGSSLIFQFLDFLALGKSFRHMHIPLKVTASLKVKKALKWPWKVYLCDVNICSDPDFNSEKADFQAPLLWTYHRVPVIKTIHRGTFGSLHLPEKILTLLYFAESKGDMLEIWKFGQILKKAKKYPKLHVFLYLQLGIGPGSAE